MRRIDRNTVASCSSHSKHTPLHELAQRIKGALHTHPLQEARRKVTAIALSAGEKCSRCGLEGTIKRLRMRFGIHGKRYTRVLSVRNPR